MGNPEKIKSGAEEVPVSDKYTQNKIQVLRCGLTIELNDAIEVLKGLFGQMGITINANNVRKEGRSGGISQAFELREEVLHERKMAGTTKFEDEGIESGVRMTEIGLTRG